MLADENVDWKTTPISGSFPYTEAQSICLYPKSNANFTEFATTPGAASHVLNNFTHIHQQVKVKYSTYSIKILFTQIQMLACPVHYLMLQLVLPLKKKGEASIILVSYSKHRHIKLKAGNTIGPNPIPFLHLLHQY